MIVNFINDLPLIRAYSAERVQAQTKSAHPVSAIEVGYRLSQGGLIVFHFDTREPHCPDGEWTSAMDGPVLELPHWSKAYESANEDGIEFVLLTGAAYKISSTIVDDESVAGVFGEALLAITLDALAAGFFCSLTLKDDCQLDLKEFDAMWYWPNETFDPDATDGPNEVRRLPLTRLKH